MIKPKPIRQKTPPANDEKTTHAATATGSKLSHLEGMLRRTEGATLPQLVEALHWQAHSIRGAMSGSLKKKRGWRWKDRAWPVFSSTACARAFPCNPTPRLSTRSRWDKAS